VTVGVTAIEVTFTNRTKDISIQAASGNAGLIYGGKSNVTSAGAAAMFELSAGQSISLDYNDADNAWYIVASVADQKIYKLALTVNPDDLDY